MEKLSQRDKKILNEYISKSEKFTIDRVFDDLIKTHPKTMNKINDITASFSDTFRTLPSGNFVDPAFLKINMRRARIYDRIKELEK